MDGRWTTQDHPSTYQRLDRCGSKTVREIKDEVEETGDLDLKEIFFGKFSEPPFIRLRDKICFCIGVLNIIVMAFLVAGYQKWFPLYYSIKYAILIPTRYFQFRSDKNQFYLLDLCYFVNLLLLSYLWIFPQSEVLFTTVFCICHGPLLFAVVLFRNSLVFHSLGKITSCFIHISPPLCCYCIRWFREEAFIFDFTQMGFSTKRYAVCDNLDEDCFGFMYTWCLPMIFWASHVTITTIITTVICPIPDDPAYSNSFRYVAYQHKGVAAIIQKSPLNTYVTYHLGCAVMNGIFILPTYLWFRNQPLNFAFTFVIVMACIWNGANFYVEVFSRKYEGVAAEQREQA